MKKVLLLLLWIGITPFHYVLAAEEALLASEKTEPFPAKSCSYSKEYITTLEFFRAHQEFNIRDDLARNLAWKVSRGCTGAAQRFIKTVSLLSKVGMATQNSIDIGIEFSKKTDSETETFRVVFYRSFLSEYLDLDIQTSLNLARLLSTEFKGDTLSVREDFNRFVDFCIDQRELNLPLSQCATFAAKLAHRGEKLPKGVSEAFIKVYSFLRSDKGPELTTRDALKMAELIMEGGDNAVDNFIQGYRYAVTQEGLALGASDAIHFAQKLTLSKE